MPNAAALLTNIRAQLVPLTLVPLVGFAVLKQWRFVVAAVLVAGINAAYLVPYLASSPDPLAEGMRPVTVMQYNIYFANTDYDGISGEIRSSDADIVVLHELLPEQWAALDERLSDYPYRIAEPLTPTPGLLPSGGMALLSRTPLDRLTVDESFSPTERIVLAAGTELHGERVTIVGLHPHASRNQAAKVGLRERQIAGVIELARQIDGPTIVATDLNMAPTSPAYQDFLEELGWRDPHRVVGWKSSWPTWGGPFGIPIDHVLVSNEFALHSYRTGDGKGSDHKPIVAELSLK